MPDKLKTSKDLFWLENTNRCGCGACDEGFNCDIEKIKQEAIKWIKKIRSMKYGEKFCLNCEEIYGGANSGMQYCPKCKVGKELHWLEQQTGKSLGAVEILMKFHNIIEEDLK